MTSAQDTGSAAVKKYPFSKLFLFALAPYSLVYLLILAIILIAEGSANLLKSALSMPLIMGLSLLGSLCLIAFIQAAGASFILNRWGLSKKSKTALVLWGTYWINIFFVPLVIYRGLVNGSWEMLLLIPLLGPVFFLIPSLVLLPCYRSMSESGQTLGSHLLRLSQCKIAVLISLCACAFLWMLSPSAEERNLSKLLQSEPQLDYKLIELIKKDSMWESGGYGMIVHCNKADFEAFKKNSPHFRHWSKLNDGFTINLNDENKWCAGQNVEGIISQAEGGKTDLASFCLWDEKKQRLYIAFAEAAP